MTRMDVRARAWMVTVAADHFWRVAAWYEFDDLIQDGHMIWWKLIQRYEREQRRIRSRAHMGQLFKRSFLNHIHYLANKKRGVLSERRVLDLLPHIDNPAEYDALGVITSVRDESSDFDRVVAEAPGPLRALLNVMIAGTGVKAWCSSCRVNADGTRTTTSSKFCSMLGIPDDGGAIAEDLWRYLKQR